MNLRVFVMYYFVPILFISHCIWCHYPTQLNWFSHFFIIVILSRLSWTVGYYIYGYLNRKTILCEDKSILITGGDSQIGCEVAHKLERLGFYVFVGVLNLESEQVKSLSRKCSNRVKAVQMNVTSVLDVECAVQQIRDSQIPLWAVVNCAEIGFGSFGDWGNDVDDYQKAFEINLFGLIRVTKCCLDLLRQSNGRVVNVGSIFGRITLPGSSHFSMTKHCVRVFSDCLRREFLLTKSKIKVVTIEPTIHKIESIKLRKTSERMLHDSAEATKRFYAQWPFEHWFKKAESLIEEIVHPTTDVVVDSIVSAVVLTNPKPYYQCADYFDGLTFAVIANAPEIVADFLLTNL